MKEIVKRVDHFLKHYNSLKKLADSPQRDAWSLGAKTVIKDIDQAIKALDGSARSILDNRFIVRAKDRLPRSKMCKQLELSPKEYGDMMNEALKDFASAYRDGILLD